MASRRRPGGLPHTTLIMRSSEGSYLAGRPMTLPDAVRDVWLSLGDPTPSLVVAVSGGPDSVALARALAEARPPSVPLVVAHLNHQLRGEHSDADEKFVADFASTLPGVR